MYCFSGVVVVVGSVGVGVNFVEFLRDFLKNYKG